LAEPIKPGGGRLEAAIRLFNRGAYFEAAEAFERVFAETDCELRALAGALNRIGAALHLRFERGACQSPINLLSEAALSLEELKPECDGIDVARLRVEVAAFADRLRASPRHERDGLKHRVRLFFERRHAPKIGLTR